MMCLLPLCHIRRRRSGGIQYAIQTAIRRARHFSLGATAPGRAGSRAGVAARAAPEPGRERLSNPGLGDDSSDSTDITDIISDEQRRLGDDSIDDISDDSATTVSTALHR